MEETKEVKFDKLVAFIKDEHKYYSRLLTEHTLYTIGEKDKFKMTISFIEKTCTKFNIPLE
jgi:hypothetical protein